MNRIFDRLNNEIIERDLCVHCGMCVGVCDTKRFIIRSDYNRCKPTLLKRGPLNAKDCALAYAACPGKRVNFPKLYKDSFGKIPQSPLGSFKNIYLGYSTNANIRERGASGGVVTELLLFLIREKQVNGAVVAASNFSASPFFETRIVETEEEIIKAAQSKYVLVPTNSIWGEIRRYPGKLGYVGLPCQVHALKKLAEIRPSYTENIGYIVGPYCGNNLYFEATKRVLGRFGIEDYRSIQSLEYRAGEWPGKFEVALKDGRSFSIPKFAFNYLSFFYTPQRCHLCIDLTNEFADISLGDGWAYEKREPGLGWSVIITRTDRGQELIHAAREAGVVFLEEIDEKAAINMHSHGLDNKRVGALIRMEHRSRRGLSTPDYYMQYSKATLGRRTREIISLFILWLCSFEVSERLVHKVPISVLHKVLHNIREIWMKRTRVK